MDHGEARQQHDAHGGEDRPALAAVARHRAEQEAEGHRDQQDRQALREVRCDRRILKRMRRELTPEKPPPLVPSCLIAICAAAGPRVDLFSAFKANGVDRAQQGLRHALGGEKQRQRDGERP